MSNSNKKATESFKQTILNELTKRAANDPLFAVSFQKENKNIDDCINYVLSTVQKSGINGFTDSEVFGMAAHYYDEDDIGTQEEIQCRVIINHEIKLTEEEILEAKKQARDQVINAEMNRLRSTKPVAKKAEEQTQTFMF